MKYRSDGLGGYTWKDVLDPDLHDFKRKKKNQNPDPSVQRGGSTGGFQAFGVLVCRRCGITIYGKDHHHRIKGRKKSSYGCLREQIRQVMES